MSARDLVLLHGWGLHAGAWDEARPLLAPRFTVHALDLPGHGDAAHHAPQDFDDAVDAIAARMPDAAIACGWSLGGLFAQRLAVRHAAKVAKLVLVATTPCFVTRADWPHAMQPATLGDFAASLHLDRERTLRDFVHLNALHGAHGREAVRAFTRHLAERPAPSLAALEASLAWLREVDLRPDAARITQPTLVVHGSRDALAPIAAGRWLAAAIPHATLDEIEDGAHLPFFTHRERFVGALEAFVAR